MHGRPGRRGRRDRGRHWRRAPSTRTWSSADWPRDRLALPRLLTRRRCRGGVRPGLQVARAPEDIPEVAVDSPTSVPSRPPRRAGARALGGRRPPHDRSRWRQDRRRACLEPAYIPTRVRAWKGGSSRWASAGSPARVQQQAVTRPEASARLHRWARRPARVETYARVAAACVSVRSLVQYDTAPLSSR